MEEERQEFNNNDNIFNSSDYATNNELINPFLYRKKEQSEFQSIEDFALLYRVKLFKKKEIIYLRSIIRNDLIKKGKKLRVFNKYLKEEKKDFLENIDRQIEENNNKQEAYNNLTINKIKFKTKFLTFVIVLLGLLMTAFFFTKFTNLLNIGFINTINEHIKSRINIYSILLIVCALASSIGYFIYIIGFAKSNKKNKRLQAKNFKNFDKYLDMSNKTFKKSFRKVKRYYNKNIRSKNKEYEALALEELWDLKVDYQDANNINQELEKNNQELEKKNRNFKKFNGFLSFLMYAFNLVLLVYLIVSIFI